MDCTTTSSRFTIEAALSYAARGWKIYPASGKKPKIKRWNRDGASADPDTIGRWFSVDFPDANVGIATGPSRLAVIDVDPRNGGTESWRGLCERVGIGAFEGAPRVTTPRGGFHLYFAVPHPVTSGKIADGIDLQAIGAGVLAPPSTFYSKAYSWRTEDDLPENLPCLPATICSALTLKRTDEALELAAIVRSGDRNTTLTRLAGRFRRFGHADEEIYGMLCAINAVRCKPPLPDGEISDIAKSIGKRSASVDPIEWLAKWFPKLSGNALKTAAFYTLLAERGVPKITPAEEYAVNETGLWASRYRAARLSLEKCGAIRRISQRGQNQAPEIILELPNVA